MKINNIIKNRKGTISLLKFIFSLFVILYHFSKILEGNNKFEICLGGYLAVDFFFIVSGYYLYRFILKIKENVYKENVKNIVKKVKKFLPYTITIGSIYLVFKYLMHTISKSEAIMSFFNIFLIDMTGLSGYSLNGPTWYISAMLIVFFVLTPIIYNMKDTYKYYICPMIVMFGLGYLYNINTSLNIFMTQWNGYVYGGLIRALVDINLGIIVYNLSNLLLEKSNNIKRYDLKINIVSILLYLVVFIYIIFNRSEGSIDLFILVIIFFAVISTFSENKVNTFLDTRFIRYLEKISLPIFLNHFLAIEVLNKVSMLSKFNYLEKVIIGFASIFVFSILEQFVIEKITNRFKKIKNY